MDAKVKRRAPPPELLAALGEFLGGRLTTNAAVCLPTQGTPSGVNGMCGGATHCQSGLACVNGACRTPCDMAHPCAMGMCQMTNPALAFGGVCI